MQNLPRDEGFIKMADDIQFLDVNDDHGIWTSRTSLKIFFREGETSSNMLGTRRVESNDRLFAITTGKYGLVVGSS